jgi:ubiquinone/menaquinone biosynthesis C-methylase UbiE
MNFSEPTRALAEVHRVLKPGGKALVIDLRRDASPRDIAAAVAGMNLGWLNSQITKLTFKYMLLKRAHSKESIRHMAAQTPFETCEIREEQIGLEITFMKG